MPAQENQKKPATPPAPTGTGAPVEPAQQQQRTIDLAQLQIDANRAVLQLQNILAAYADVAQAMKNALAEAANNADVSTKTAPV